jgi:hypothetical protein
MADSLILYRENLALYSENYIKPISTLYGKIQSSRFEAGHIYSYCCTYLIKMFRIALYSYVKNTLTNSFSEKLTIVQLVKNLSTFWWKSLPSSSDDGGSGFV